MKKMYENDEGKDRCKWPDAQIKGKANSNSLFTWLMFTFVQFYILVMVPKVWTYLSYFFGVQICLKSIKKTSGTRVLTVINAHIRVIAMLIDNGIHELNRIRKQKYCQCDRMLPVAVSIQHRSYYTAQELKIK